MENDRRKETRDSNCEQSGSGKTALGISQYEEAESIILL